VKNLPRRILKLKETNMIQHAIKGIEIFRVGTWNGDHYTTKDLDDMVDAFGRVGFQPPVILGHVKESWRHCECANVLAAISRLSSTRFRLIAATMGSTPLPDV